jgi:hypothetical protein
VDLNNEESDEVSHLLSQIDIIQPFRMPFEYILFSVLHILVCEYWMIILECGIRIIAYAVLAFLALIFEISTRIISIREIPICAKLLCESFVSSCVLLSLLFPGTILYIYYNNYWNRTDIDGNWNLNAIPTILGMVDSRRFFTIALGSGYDAVNVIQMSTSTSQTSVNVSDHIRDSSTSLQFKCLDSFIISCFHRLAPPITLCFPYLFLHNISMYMKYSAMINTSNNRILSANRNGISSV